jgi:AraC family transcriptional regulator of adaptative response / DNA-3-methyladenine glycosylase II
LVPVATSEKLLQAAFEEIYREFQAASLDTILAQAGVTKGCAVSPFPQQGCTGPRRPAEASSVRAVVFRRPNPASPRRASGYIETMTDTATPAPMLDAESCARALASRDPRFDGVFFVGISSTMIYCRPVCPARVAYPDRRRFFPSAAAAEHDGFRPCLRCRPELAPGRALVDAVPRVARAAAIRIAAGALNGRGVGHLAHELGVGERQLRRAMERELGVSPVELAQTHRLLLAKCLLTDTVLPVTRVAFASGFQSLRRFNTVFQERYRMSPSALRRRRRTAAGVGAGPAGGGPAADLVRLTLTYRPPLAWEPLLQRLAADATPGVETVASSRYTRTVELGGCRGVVSVERAVWSDASRRLRGASADRVAGAGPGGELAVYLSASLLPALMPLLARLRQLFDLDAEPSVIDAHLRDGGLGPLVLRQPGVRMHSAFDGFEAALGELLRDAQASVGGASAADPSDRLAQRVAEALGEPIDGGAPGLTRLSPSAETVAGAGAPALMRLGVPERIAEAIVAVARAASAGGLRLEPGADASSTLDALTEIPAIGERTATAIVMRALQWPDAFPAGDPALQRAAGAAGPRALLHLAERWRPWRAYAAAHLSLLATLGRVGRPGVVRPREARPALGGRARHAASAS